ncbi:MAG: hypothetical protein KDM64_00345 [Verrucomicrobiae bacterium]|nr:hypothetical protein [Verrucomicrobiae bacterium]MCB1091633.1 hypothetical protein [Verrucomicrobiae bacterium]
MKLKLFVYSMMGAIAIPFANAGDAKGVTEAVVAEEPLGGTISAGYMSNYIFYGVDFGSNAVWTGVDYAVAGTPLNVGVWYINPTDGNLDDELDIYASVGQEIAGFDASLTMTGYFFPDSGADATYELGIGLERSLGIVDWNATARYDFEVEGYYFETGISKGIAVADNIELVLSTGISYQIDYFASGGEFNHVYLMASLPIALRSNVTLEPYVAGLFALDAIDDFQDDIVHGGVSLSVSF